MARSVTGTQNMASPSKPLLAPTAPEFRVLGRGVTILHPDDALTLSSTGATPTLILVLSWMAAPTRHVKSYLAEYRLRYPSSTIVHISTSLIDATVRPDVMRRRELKPVVDIITSEASRCSPSQPRILLHLFSNGGAYTTSQLAIAYRRQTGCPLPAAAVVLDSTPGKATFSLTLRAMKIGLASTPLLARMLGTAAVTLGLAVYFLLERLGVKNVIELARHILNNKNLISPKAPRLYIFSNSDELVLWQDVEAHSHQAEAKGISTRRLVFDKTGHVGHVRVRKDEYWSAVAELWISSLTTAS